MPINQLGTVSVPEPRMLSVQVWDRSMAKAVEKAIDDVGSREADRMKRSLRPIRNIAMVAPLLGLLGTVTGMIEVFNVMAVTGGGDAKSMAGGVERSTIPTMAGMVSALSGLFANTQLQRMAAREQQLLEDQLTSDH